MTVLQQIPAMTDGELSKLFYNALESLRKGKQIELADAVKSAVLDEWDKRLKQFKSGEYKADTPVHGVLSTMGYKVGNDGIDQESRRYLLNYIMREKLPAVGSPAYMAEWGEPETRSRYKKLHRVLQVFISSANTLGSMDKAKREWETDLKYIELTWDHLK